MHSFETGFSSEHGRDVTILIVEDDEMSRRALAQILRLHGYTAQAAGSAEGALASLDCGLDPGVALVDLDLPGMSGAELIETLRRKKPSIHSILMTAADNDRVRRIMHGSNVVHVRKPINLEELLPMISEAAGSHAH